MGRWHALFVEREIVFGGVRPGHDRHLQNERVKSEQAQCHKFGLKLSREHIHLLQASSIARLAIELVCLEEENSVLGPRWSILNFKFFDCQKDAIFQTLITLLVLQKVAKFSLQSIHFLLNEFDGCLGSLLTSVRYLPWLNIGLVTFRWTLVHCLGQKCTHKSIETASDEFTTLDRFFIQLDGFV